MRRIQARHQPPSRSNQTPELTNPGFSNIGADTNTNQINITNTFTPFGTITKTIGRSHHQGRRIAAQE